MITLFLQLYFSYIILLTHLTYVFALLGILLLEVQKVVEVIVPPVVITVIQEKEPLPVKVPVITSETFQSYKDHTNEAFEVFKK